MVASGTIRDIGLYVPIRISYKLLFFFEGGRGGSTVL